VAHDPAIYEEVNVKPSSWSFIMMSEARLLFVGELLTLQKLFELQNFLVLRKFPAILELPAILKLLALGKNFARDLAALESAIGRLLRLSDRLPAEFAAD